jgi:hypothetical protein
MTEYETKPFIHLQFLKLGICVKKVTEVNTLCYDGLLIPKPTILS